MLNLHIWIRNKNNFVFKSLLDILIWNNLIFFTPNKVTNYNDFILNYTDISLNQLKVRF